MINKLSYYYLNKKQITLKNNNRFKTNNIKTPNYNNNNKNKKRFLKLNFIQCIPN